MERVTFDCNFCDVALCYETKGGIFCNENSCVQRKTWERLKAIEDILGDDYNLDRLRELVEADVSGRIVPLPCLIGECVFHITHSTKITAEGLFPVPVVDAATFTWDMIPKFGKTVFLTLEEANACLDSMKKAV